MMNKQLIAQLSQSNYELDKYRLSEMIIDLYEDNYIFDVPTKEDVSFITNSLLTALHDETNYKVIYELLSAFYKWSWFPDNNDVDFDELLIIFNETDILMIKEIIIRIFISTGSSDYYLFYKECLKNTDLKDLAEEGIDSLSNKGDG